MVSLEVDFTNAKYIQDGKRESMGLFSYLSLSIAGLTAVVSALVSIIGKGSFYVFTNSLKVVIIYLNTTLIVRG